MNNWHIMELVAKEQHHDLERRIRLDALVRQVRSGQRLTPVSCWVTRYIIPRLRHSQTVEAKPQMT